MAKYDLVIFGGTIIDGSGAQRYVGDISILDGKIARIGQVSPQDAGTVIDAKGLIVAPGIVDLHSHYDAQINWDPYCTTSSWHGTTTTVMGACGFGFAPVRPGMADRYLRMMENTEQVPYAAMKAGLKMDWETFPDWMNRLKNLPKGINVAQYLPFNPLLSYVVGPDESKKRPATADERKRMREILHEAMDHGAVGFAFSYLGIEGNSHVDFDQSPMPSDVMAMEEAYNLCDVLKERNQGVIQLLSDMGGMGATAEKYQFVEEMARRSGRPVLHNVTFAVPGRPEIHRGTMAWLDACAAKGLQIYSQAFVYRSWMEFKAMDYNVADCIPLFRTLSAAHTVPERMALARSEEFRERMRREYDPAAMYQAVGPLEYHVLQDAAGAAAFVADQGKFLEQIAKERQLPVTDVFLDILIATEMQVTFLTHGMSSRDPNDIEELLRHPRMLTGGGDAGAHGKVYSGGHWSTDLNIWLTRETGRFTSEEVHEMLTGRAAAMFGFDDRGLLKVGRVADIIIYDFDKLNFEYGKYRILHDLPGGEWRRTVPVTDGMRYTIVNGQVTFKDNQCTGLLPGRVVSNHAFSDDAGLERSAEQESVAVK